MVPLVLFVLIYFWLKSGQGKDQGHTQCESLKTYITDTTTQYCRFQPGQPASIKLSAGGLLTVSCWESPLLPLGHIYLHYKHTPFTQLQGITKTWHLLQTKPRLGWFHIEDDFLRISVQSLSYNIKHIEATVVIWQYINMWNLTWIKFHILLITFVVNFFTHQKLKFQFFKCKING